MPKQLINIIGLIISLGVIALGIVLVAVPLWVQSLSVDAQTATVANTNALYVTQVQALQAEAERQDEIDASVAALQAQIPAANDLDDVFEVVARAADETGVTLTSAAAGTPVAFVVRTGPTRPGEEAVPPATPAPEAGSNGSAEGESADGGSTGDTTDGSAAPAAPAEEEPLSGRQQIDFSIAYTATDMEQATAFLDALRAGPRLLSTIATTALLTGNGVEGQVSALTFLDSEG